MQLVKLPEKDIVKMICFPVVNEACQVLDKGIANLEFVDHFTCYFKLLILFFFFFFFPVQVSI
jgi:hypothetical protein